MALVQIVLLITVHENGVIARPPFTTPKATKIHPIFQRTHNIYPHIIFGAIIFVIVIVGSTSWRIDKTAKVWNMWFTNLMSPLSVATTTLTTSALNQSIPIFYFVSFFRFWYHKNFTNIKSKYVISVLIFIYLFGDIHNGSSGSRSSSKQKHKNLFIAVIISRFVRDTIISLSCLSWVTRENSAEIHCGSIIIIVITTTMRRTAAVTKQRRRNKTLTHRKRER